VFRTKEAALVRFGKFLLETLLEPFREDQCFDGF
jgi:hypothetical protein